MQCTETTAKGKRCKQYVVACGLCMQHLTKKIPQRQEPTEEEHEREILA